MRFTRRQVFQAGALAGLARLLGKGTAPERVDSSLQAGTALWAGDALQTTVEVTGYTGSAGSSDLIGLRTALNRELSDGVVDYPAAVHNASGFNKWSLTGLEPGIIYWHRLTINGAPHGPVCRFRTLRPIGVPCTTTIAAGGCKRDVAMDSVFRDIVDWGPDRVMNLGDMGYPAVLTTDPATHEANWAKQLLDPPMKLIQAQGCVDYIASDHDTTGGADNPPNFDNPVSAENLVAWAEMVPARIVDRRSPPRARYRSEVEGNVRFVKLDSRNQDRTKVTDGRLPGDPRSTMLGATQLAWLKGEIEEAAAFGQFLCIFSDTGWYGTAALGDHGNIMVSNSDKWVAYTYERDLISDHIASVYASFGKGVNALVVCSDTHALQQDSGTGHRNGLASVVCGPFDQHVHALPTFVESYEWTYPPDADSGGLKPRQRSYQRLIFDESVPGTMKVTVLARDCTSSKGPKDRRRMVKSYTL